VNRHLYETECFIPLAASSRTVKGYRPKSFPPDRLSPFESRFFSYYDTASKGGDFTSAIRFFSLCLFLSFFFWNVFSSFRFSFQRLPEKRELEFVVSFGDISGGDVPKSLKCQLAILSLDRCSVAITTIPRGDGLNELQSPSYFPLTSRSSGSVRLNDDLLFQTLRVFCNRLRDLFMTPLFPWVFSSA